MIDQFEEKNSYSPRSNIPVTGSLRILQERCWKVTGSCRKTLEIAVIWKQYFDQKTAGFFPAYSCQFPVLSSRNRSEIIGKNPKISDWNTASKKITGITQNRSFPGRTVGPGQMDIHHTMIIHEHI